MIRHILYIADDFISLLSWHNHKLLSRVVFYKEDEDIESFKLVAKSLSRHPVQILISLQEEDYQRETIAHAKKKDQAFMANRLLEKYYRDSRYTHYKIQGRNEDGRKDNRVLLSSLSINAIDQRYIDSLFELNLPIAGIWSAPILSHHLLESACVESVNYILVVDEGHYTRESIFIKNELIISRKIRHDDNLSDDKREKLISSSIEHLYKFSTNKRFIDFQQVMDVFCVFDKPLFGMVSDKNVNNNINYQYVDKNSFPIGMVSDKEFEVDVDVDVIYAHICESKNLKKPDYFKQEEVDIFAKSQKFRLLNFSGIVFSSLFLFSALLISTNNYSLNKINKKNTTDIQLFTQGYEETFSDIQHMLDDIDNVNYLLSEASRNYAQSAQMPTNIFGELSEVMDNNKFVDINIKKIRWKRYEGVEYDAVSALFPKENFAEQVAEDDLGLDVVEEVSNTKVYMHLSGFFDVSTMDYAGAVDVMVYFNNALKTISHVDDVYMISAPVDVRSQSQFIDFSGSLLSININKDNTFEFVLAIKKTEVIDVNNG